MRVRFPRPGLRFLSLLLLFGWSAVAARARESSLLSGQLSLDAWHVEDGLPDNTVTSIVQTGDGYLWIGTFLGLVRFDGLQFTLFDSTTPGIESERATRLFVDQQGTLWVTMEFGQIARYINGRFVPMTKEDGWPGLSVKWMANSPTGTLLVTVGKDDFGPRVLLEYKEGRFHEVLTGAPASPERIRSGNSVGDTVVEVEKSGREWVIQDRHLGTLEAGQWKPWQPPEGGEPPSISRIAASPRGGLWVCAGGQIRRLIDGRWSGTEPAFSWPASDTVMEMMEDSAGQLWVGSWDRGLLRCSPDGRTERLLPENGYPARTTGCVFEDREHNLWAGTSGGGLLRLRRQTFTAYMPAAGLPRTEFTSVAPGAGGQGWAGTSASSVWHLEGHDLQGPEPIPGMIEPPTVRTVLAARGGSVWLGLHGNRLIRMRGGEKTIYTRQEGLDHEVYYTLFEDRDGTLWIGGDRGLSRFDGRGFQTYDTRHGLPSVLVWAIAQDAAGDLWIGTSGNGLARMHAGRFQTYGRREGLPNDTVRSLLADADGTIWIGTSGGGLCRLREGRFASFSAAAGLPGNTITGIADDGLGFLWLNSNRGLVRASRSSLDDVAAGLREQAEVSTYVTADGLPSIASAGGSPTAVRAADGRLWFAMEKGLCIADPRSIKPNPVPPPAVIEDIQVDGKTVYSNGPRGPASERGLLILKPGSRRLEIRYAGLSLSAPERVRFRYRLDGLENHWEEAGSRRTATFHLLPPGGYHFRLAAANSDGLWNSDITSFELRVLPAWWQTWWFRTGLAAAVAGAIAGGYSFRIRALTRARILQEGFSRHLIASQEQERKRIAGELHDSLGQNLLVIKNRVAMAQQQSDPASKLSEQLAEAASMTSHAIREVREISQNLRPLQLDELGLTKALNSMVRKVAAASSIQFECDIAELQGAFTPEFEINLYRILQECLNNVVKHSQAARCVISITRTSGQVRVSVSDNGQGFTAGGPSHRPDTAEGFGMAGIAERVRTLGGTLDLSTKPGHGVTIAITVPLNG